MHLWFYQIAKLIAFVCEKTKNEVSIWFFHYDFKNPKSEISTTIDYY